MRYLKKFKLYEKSSDILNIESIILKIQSVLTPDLLKGIWKGDHISNKFKGHCYAATEALYWILGGPKSGYDPYVMSNATYPELLKNEGESHWYLKNRITGKVLDITKDQFGDYDIDYDRGKINGMMNHPFGGSKRAKEIINRIEKLEK